MVLVGLIIAIGWTSFAPVAVEGEASYVITEGESMLPTLEANGLVVTRAQDSYDIGGVVAYRNEKFGVVVLHRIVALEGDTYVLEGDNNGFRDHYQPIGDNLVGVKWILLA